MNNHVTNAKNVTTQKEEVNEFKSKIIQNKALDIVIKETGRKSVKKNFNNHSSSIINNEIIDYGLDFNLTGHTDVKRSDLNYARKVKLTKESVKRYRVIVSYVDVEEDKRKIKRAIIEDILKNS